MKKTIYRYVTYDEKSGSYEARPEYKGVRKRVGRYPTPQETHEAVENWIAKEQQKTLKWVEGIYEKGEEWRDVVGFEGVYKVSSFGRVKNITMSHPGLIQGSPINGYLGFSSPKVDGNRRKLFIHVIVAQAFLEYIPNGRHDVVIDHIDRVKDNNKVDNLRLVSNWLNTVRSYDSYKINMHCIKELPSGNYTVRIRRRVIGTFSNLEDARSERDLFIIKNNMI